MDRGAACKPAPWEYWAWAARLREDETITWFNGILAYLMIWWVVLFAVLPWGVKVPERPEKGHASSAPERPMLWRKAAITTVVAGAVWLGVYAVIESGLIAIRPG